MSRIARKPITIPSGVEVTQQGDSLKIKGPKGEFLHQVYPGIEVVKNDNSLQVSLATEDPSHTCISMLGTTCVLLNNFMIGVSAGFEKKLTLVGVGYRAKAKGSSLDLSLGFSHPVNYDAPKGISLEAPSNTEILVKGADKQKVGQVAAEIRALRPPEPYKGKGVRYADEHLTLKETKKK